MYMPNVTVREEELQFGKLFDMCCAGMRAILQLCVPLLQWTLSVGQCLAHGWQSVVCYAQI